ncbi:MAG: ribosomal protein [Firmicutes bacterium]|nr:ribosomal protein [Bacillota bacterium]
MKEEGIIKVERKSHSSSGANTRLRKDGYLPGNIYGKGIGSIPISIKEDDLQKNLARFGRNAVYKLDLSGEKTYNVVIRDIQYLPVKHEHMHVEFQKITLSEDIKTDVSIRLSGEESLDDKGLVLLQQMDTITLKGFPRKMPDVIEIDVSDMKAGDSMTIGSIEFPKGVICVLDPEQIVLAVKESHMQGNIEEGNDSIEKELLVH